MTNTNTLVTEKTAPQPVASTVSTGTTVTQTYNPGQPSNLTASETNKTTNFFNNFFIPEQTVSANVDDALVGFFQTQTGDKVAGKLLAAAVINTALQQKEDPMSVLDEFRKMSPGELNVYLALYLNLSRVNSSLIGVKNVPVSSKYVSRSIIL